MKNRRVLIIIGIVLGSLVLVAGLALGAIALFGWAAGEPIIPDPEYPVVIGVRAEDDHLIISTGSECPKGAKLDINFPYSSKDTAAPRFILLTLREPVTVFDPTEPGPGLRVTYTFPDEVHVQLDRERVEITTTFPHLFKDSYSYVGVVEFTDLQEESVKHSVDQFYFGEMGWLTSEEVAERDGVDLLTVCRPRGT